MLLSMRQEASFLSNIRIRILRLPILLCIVPGDVPLTAAWLGELETPQWTEQQQCYQAGEAEGSIPCILQGQSPVRVPRIWGRSVAGAVRIRLAIRHTAGGWIRSWLADCLLWHRGVQRTSALSLAPAVPWCTRFSGYQVRGVGG
jgi:hypothetical protein